MIDLNEIWVFNGANSSFPSGVFRTKKDAEIWIGKYKLTGVLTKYPIGISVYEWAIEGGHFKVKSEKHTQPEFIGKFSSAAQEHWHYEEGASD
jgi:hypothetical protein